MKRNLLLTNLLLLLSMSSVYSQSLFPKTCGTDYVVEEMFRANPALREVYNTQFLRLSERAKLLGRNSITNEVIEIPVVVHVLEDGNPTYYKTDQEIINWINRANSIFNGTATDILNASQGGAEIPVRLVLAKRTPQNQSTTGIVRYDLSQNAEYVTNGVKYYSTSTKGIPHSTLVAGKQWSTSSYYNVYINNKFEGVDGYRGGLMGFAYFPGGSSDYSFMVTANLKSTDTTFAHEMMHAFGIKHVFAADDGNDDGNGTTCGGIVNDGIDDTQRTKSMLSAWPVPTNNDFNDCAGENYDGVQHNMMNYGSALNRFTPGQRNLAYQTIENLRGSMKTSLGAVPVTTTSNNIPVPLQNCEITGSNQSSLFYIQNVEFGSVVSKPGYVNTNYVDYTLDNNINTAFYSTFFEGETFQLKVSSDLNASNRRKLAAYIDYNNNGQFEANEMVVAPTLVNSGETSISVNITIPTGVVKNKNLRFRLVSGIDNVYLGYQDVTYGACDYRKTGQVFDYSIIVKDEPQGCEGISDNISAIISTDTTAALNSNFTLKAYGVAATSAITMQWQKSNNGTDWTNIEGATSLNYTGTVSGNVGQTNYYRLKVACESNEYFSSTVSHIVTSMEYCTAKGLDASYEMITNVKFADIDNSSSSTAGYEDFTSIVGNVYKGNTYNFTAIDARGGYPMDQVLVWIDFNQNKVFEENEKVLTTNRSISPWSGNITIPNTALSGETRMRVRLHDSSDGPNSTACGDSRWGQVEDYTINIKNQVTIWENGAWSNGVPTLAKEAIIKDNLVITTGELAANKLTVEAGSLTINNGAVLRLENEFVNQLTADKVIFENEAFLMQNNASALNTGDVTYKRNSTPIYRLETLMWSSPVDGQKIKDLSPNTLDNRFTLYDESTNTWVQAPINNDFTPAEMVAFRVPNNFANFTTRTIPGQIFTGIFRGTPNNGTVTIGVNKSTNANGFNGIGNPYPSPINLQSFLNDATNKQVGIDALYFWTRDKKIINGAYEGGAGSNWITYNNIGWSENISTTSIAPAQGFIAKVNSSGELQFTNAMRVANGDNVAYRNESASKYWLELHNANSKLNTTLVGYAEGATKDFDTTFDAKPMQDSEGIFTLLNEDKFVIQGRGESIDVNDVIGLNYTISQEGNYTIKLVNPLGEFQNQSIYLVDKELNQVINLSENTEYSFIANAGSNSSRFEIVYQPRTLSTFDQSLEKEVEVYLNNKTVFVRSKEVIDSVDIYDLTGKLITKSKNINSTNYSSKLDINSSVLIINIELDNGKKVAKKIILK